MFAAKRIRGVNGIHYYHYIVDTAYKVVQEPSTALRLSVQVQATTVQG